MAVDSTVVEIYDAVFGEEDFVDSFQLSGNLSSVASVEIDLRRYVSEMGEDTFGYRISDEDIENAATELVEKQEADIGGFRLVVV